MALAPLVNVEVVTSIAEEALSIFSATHNSLCIGSTPTGLAGLYLLHCTTVSSSPSGVRIEARISLPLSLECWVSSTLYPMFLSNSATIDSKVRGATDRAVRGSSCSSLIRRLWTLRIYDRELVALSTSHSFLGVTHSMPKLIVKLLSVRKSCTFRRPFRGSMDKTLPSRPVRGPATTITICPARIAIRPSGRAPLSPACL